MKNMYLIILFLSCELVMSQQPGDKDTSFTPDSFNRYVYDLVVKDDGKILVGTGAPAIGGGIPVNGIFCLNPNGSIETSFNAPENLSFVRKIALQADGKIIVLGNIGMNGQDGSIARLNPDGSLDPNFYVGTNTSSSSPVETVVIQDDGKIVIAGSFTTFNGIIRDKIARLNSDGSLDAVFATINGLPADSYSGFNVHKQADGKIMLAGRVLSTQIPRIYLSRLNPDGTVDESFNSQVSFTTSGGIFPAFISSIQTKSDGKILIVGDFLASNGTYGISMLNADGSIDTDFDPGVGAISNMDTSGAVRNALIESSGKAILFGNIKNYYIADVENTPRKMLRINSNGSIDSTFPLVGPSIESEIFAGTLQSDGKILIGGFRIIRLLSDANLGLASDEIVENLIIYPNPVNNILTIKSTFAISEIGIFNSLGQVVSQQMENFSENNIDMTSFPAGIYFVKITSNKKNLVRKIIKN